MLLEAPGGLEMEHNIKDRTQEIVAKLGAFQVQLSGVVEIRENEVEVKILASLQPHSLRCISTSFQSSRFK